MSTDRKYLWPAELIKEGAPELTSLDTGEGLFIAESPYPVPAGTSRYGA